MRGCRTVNARNPENAAAGFGAGDEVSLGVESENANVSFVAGVKEFALAVGSDGENPPFIPGGDVEGAVRAEGEIPNVFRFGIEKTDFSPEAETR